MTDRIARTIPITVTDRIVRTIRITVTDQIARTIRITVTDRIAVTDPITVTDQIANQIAMTSGITRVVRKGNVNSLSSLFEKGLWILAFFKICKPRKKTKPIKQDGKGAGGVEHGAFPWEIFVQDKASKEGKAGGFMTHHYLAETNKLVLWVLNFPLPPPF